MIKQLRVLRATLLVASLNSFLLCSNFCAAFAPWTSGATTNHKWRKSNHHADVARTSSTPTSTLFMASGGLSSEFLTPALAQACVETAGGTPLYAYSLSKLAEAADACLAFPNAYGLTVRYAMKACPNAAILQYFHSRGIKIDASSGYEVRRAIAAGVPPENISLSSQELPVDFDALLDMGVKINCCSVSQIERIGATRPGSTIGIRVNPGVGSGGFSSSTTSFSKVRLNADCHKQPGGRVTEPFLRFACYLFNHVHRPTWAVPAAALVYGINWWKILTSFLPW